MLSKPRFVSILPVLILVGLVCTRVLLSSDLPFLTRMLRAALVSFLAVALYGAIRYVVSRYLPEARKIWDVKREHPANAEVGTHVDIMVDTEDELPTAATRPEPAVTRPEPAATRPEPLATAPNDALGRQMAQMVVQDPNNAAVVLRGMTAASGLPGSSQEGG